MFSFYGVLKNERPENALSIRSCCLSRTTAVTWWFWPLKCVNSKVKPKPKHGKSVQMKTVSLFFKSWTHGRSAASRCRAARSDVRRASVDARSWTSGRSGQGRHWQRTGARPCYWSAASDSVDRDEWLEVVVCRYLQPTRKHPCN